MNDFTVFNILHTYIILTFALRTWSPSWRRAGSTSRSRQRTAGPTLVDRGRRRATSTLPLRTVPLTAFTAKGLCKERFSEMFLSACVCVFILLSFFHSSTFEKVVSFKIIFYFLFSFFFPTEPFYLIFLNAYI